MLQQILHDMWVDPELLANLDEDAKQTLFCRMREEQVRKWALWDKKQEEDGKRPKSTYANKIERQVGFLLGEDGEPWVWVMGEHSEDKKIEDILEAEAREIARQQAEKEAQQLRKSVEAELTELLDLNQKQIAAMEADQRKQENMIHESPIDIYCSADELKEKCETENPFPNNVVLRKKINNINVLNIEPKVTVKREMLKRETLNEISLNQPSKVSQRVAQWEKKVMEERTSEIFKRLKSKQLEVAREAEEAELKQDHLWREQERKAKEAEQQIRLIARRAREEHRRTSVLDMEVERLNNSPSPTLESSLSPTSSSSLSPSLADWSAAKPPNREAVVEWFRSSEVARRAGLEKDSNTIAPWFHGLITRTEAESLLSNQPRGSFLVRLSERIWGYAITYRDGERCKHYLIDASSGHYQFLGHNQIMHDTLSDFIRYYGRNPISALGKELLLMACPRNGIPEVFQGPLAINPT